MFILLNSNDKIISVIQMSIDYGKIGLRIGQRRRELNLKQKDLAEMINISPKYLSAIETGRRHTSLETIVALCEALDTTSDYFLLGNIKKEIDNNIIDNLKLCSEKDKTVIQELIKICANKSQK